MIKVLFKGDWLSVVERDGWEFVYDHRCKGRGVALLPYRREDNGRIVFLIRKEPIPCWGDGRVPCSISGMRDEEGETPEQTAARELKEETGYQIQLDELVSLGMGQTSKASSTTVNLYTVDLTGHDAGPAENAEKGIAVWVPNPVQQSNDSLLGLLLARMFTQGVLP